MDNKEDQYKTKVTLLFRVHLFLTLKKNCSKYLLKYSKLMRYTFCYYNEFIMIITYDFFNQISYIFDLSKHHRHCSYRTIEILI